MYLLSFIFSVLFSNTFNLKKVSPPQVSGEVIQRRFLGARTWVRVPSSHLPCPFFLLIKNFKNFSSSWPLSLCSKLNFQKYIKFLNFVETKILLGQSIPCVLSKINVCDVKCETVRPILSGGDPPPLRGV